MGGLKCPGACLLEMMRADALDTQEALLDWFLLPLRSPMSAPQALELTAAPPEVLVRTPTASRPREHLLKCTCIT
jgi:hypothetical protein